MKHAPFLAAVSIVIGLASCQKKDTPNFSNSQTPLSTTAQAQLVSSQANWNTYGSAKAVFDSYQVTGSVGNEAARQALISSITADNSFVASGNVLDASSLQVLTVQDLSQENNTVRDSLSKYSAQQIAVGDKIVTIKWHQSSTTFTTQCIVADSGIVWDNLLTNVVMMDTTPVVKPANAPNMAGTGNGNTIGDAITPQYIAAWYSYNPTWQLNWIWGSKRGEMGYGITIYCYSNATVYSTDHTDFAYMDLGNAKSDSKTLVNSGRYGQVQYALGISTPTVSLSFSNSNWKVSASGLGSNIVENGTKTLTPYNVN